MDKGGFMKLLNFIGVVGETTVIIYMVLFIIVVYTLSIASTVYLIYFGIRYILGAIS